MNTSLKNKIFKLLGHDYRFKQGSTTFWMLLLFITILNREVSLDGSEYENLLNDFRDFSELTILDDNKMLTDDELFFELSDSTSSDDSALSDDSLNTIRMNDHIKHTLSNFSSINSYSYLIDNTIVQNLTDDELHEVLQEFSGVNNNPVVEEIRIVFDMNESNDNGSEVLLSNDAKLSITDNELELMENSSISTITNSDTL